MDNTPPKFALLMAVVIGGYLGEIIPTMLGAGYFSIWGILGGAAGSIVMLWVTWKAFTQWF